MDHIFILALSTKDAGLWLVFVWNIAIRLLEGTFHGGKTFWWLVTPGTNYQRPRTAVPTKILPRSATQKVGKVQFELL
jgi:hypothetical protein